MAITIRQTPREVVGGSPDYTVYGPNVIFSQNPAVFVIIESDIGTYKFAYTCLVEYRIGFSGTFTTAGTLRVTKNNADCGIFDLTVIMSSLIETTWHQYFEANAQNPSFIVPSNSEMQFKLTFGSEESQTASGPPSANPGVAVNTYTAINGSTFEQGDVLPSGYPVSPPPFSTPYDFDTVYASPALSNKRFLTAAFLTPEAANVGSLAPTIYVGDSDYGYMDFVNGTITNVNYLTGFIITLYQGLTVLGTDTFLMPSSGDDEIVDNSVGRIFCYPLYMGTSTYPGVNTRLTLPANVGWTHYTVVGRSLVDSSYASAAHTFVRRNACQTRSARFLFLNRMGGTDFLNTTGKWRRDIQMERGKFRRQVGNWSVADGTQPNVTTQGQAMWGYDKADRGLVSLPISNKHTYKVSTGPLTPHENALFIAMMQSRAVFCTGIQTTSQDFLPVVINTDNVRVLTQANSDFIEYEIEVEYSQGARAQNLGETAFVNSIA